MGVRGQCHAPTALLTEGTRWYLFTKRLSGVHSRSGRNERRQIYWQIQHSNPRPSNWQNSHYTEIGYPRYYWFREVQHTVEITAWLRLFHTAINWAVEHWCGFTSNRLPPCWLLTFTLPLQHKPLHLIQIKRNINISYRTAPSWLQAFLFSPNSTTKSVSAFDFQKLICELTAVFMLNHPFEERSQNCEKRLLVSSCPSVRTSVRIELRSHWIDFHENKLFPYFSKICRGKSN
jgi:hypothetical protein